jgi:hypothetical protein
MIQNKRIAIFLKSQAAGGGRTLSANATKRSLEETGLARKMDIGVKAALSRFAMAIGAAECAATQTVHVADSVRLE